MGAILMVTVPDTIMRSECRGEAQGTMPKRSTSKRDANVALTMRTRLGAGETRCPTLTQLYRGADWMERECYDMFGIVFEGHPDLRRILLSEDWEGYPLRKDYAVDTPFAPYR